MSNIFPRAAGPLPIAAKAEGVWIEDTEGKRYIDGAGGAIVVNVGHGDTSVAAAVSDQMAQFSYVHASQFTANVLEAYGEELAPYLPMDDPMIFPVSGGSEANETAFKMARAYHAARGEGTRHKIISRWGSYHGNTRGALDISGRQPLREPYLPWLTHAVHAPPVYEYRCPMMEHPDSCGIGHAEELERLIESEGPDTVAAFIAEPIGGATTGASIPTDDYWPAVVEVCKRHGVLLIADEVMTGFGRTGTWFGVDHWDVKPDLLTAGKGASSGYWPLGLAVASGEVGRTINKAGFVHGFTYSHHAVGAAVGRAVLRKLVDGNLIEASRTQGERLRDSLRKALQNNEIVGDIRGQGMLVGIEFVANKETKVPFPRSDKLAERIAAEAKSRGLLVYTSTGSANGHDGDIILFGPPFTITNDEITQLVEITLQSVSVAQG